MIRIKFISKNCKHFPISCKKSEKFAKNIFYGIKSENHHGSIHFVKKDPNLVNENNVLIDASEIRDLKDFLKKKVPVIEMTKNMNINVKTDKWNGKI